MTGILVLRDRKDQMSRSFPAEFEDLEPFAGWAEPTESGRFKHRRAASLADSERFYNAMMERAPDALAYLDGFPLAELDEEQGRLMSLCLGLTECAITVEMYRDPAPKYLFPIDRFVPVHDRWPRFKGGEG